MMGDYLSPKAKARDLGGAATAGGFPYPLPEELAKRFEARRFGELWKAYAPRYEQYLDPETGEVDWDDPFVLGILERWFWAFTPLWKPLYLMLLQQGLDENRYWLVMMNRAISDLDTLLDFSVETWKYDPMIREQIPDVSPASPDDRPLKAVNQE